MRVTLKQQYTLNTNTRVKLFEKDPNFPLLNQYCTG